MKATDRSIKVQLFGRNLTDSVAKLCDPMAFACIIKLNTTTGEETEYQRNAGLGSGPPQVSN